MLELLKSSFSPDNLSSVVVANGLGACLMMVLLFSKRRHVRIVSLDDKIFYLMCMLNLTLCIVETISFFIDGQQFYAAREVARAINALLFLCDSVFAYLWTLYIDYKLFEDRTRLFRIYSWLAIPALILCILSVASLFADVLFAVDAQNVYARTPLTYVAYFVSYCYLTYGVVLVFCCGRKRKKYLFVPVTIFMIPVYLGSLVQMLHYGVALLWVSVAFGLTSLYINLQNEESFLDPLTQLYNRKYLFRYLRYRMGRIKEGDRLSGIMLDINSFKQINDCYGHSEGDRVLRTIGRILMHCADPDAIVTRYGGDEFIIVLPEATRGSIEELQSRIQEEVSKYNQNSGAPYEISISIGVCDMEIHRETLKEFFQILDRRMYEDKRAHYAGFGKDHSTN